MAHAYYAMVHVTNRLLSAAPIWLTIAALVSPTVPAIPKALVLGIFAVAAWNPCSGLLYLAGLAPLGALISTAFDIELFRLTEALALAFLGASVLRGWPRADVGPRLPRWALAGAWLFTLLVIGSMAGLAWRASAVPGALEATLTGLAQRYHGFTDLIGVVDAARLFEGLGTAAAVIVLFRTRPALAEQLPAVLAAAAVAAAGSSALVWYGVGPSRVLQAQIGYRVAGHVGDLNAAGSYFVLVLCLALGVALRERGSARAIWLAAAAACEFGLWLSRSKTAYAVAAVVIPVTFTWALTTRWRPSKRLTLLAALLIALIAGGVIRARRLDQDPTYMGSGFRSQFVQASLRMIAARPLFGVGVGRYFPDSTFFLSPQLAWTYGTENAHNNFLHIASETGVVGFTLFGLLIAGGLGVAARALWDTPRDWRLLGAFAGVVAFLGTCLAGHPLLVTEVAIPFWAQFGLVAALGSSSLINRRVVAAAAQPSLTDHPAIRRSAFAGAAVAAAAVLVIALTASALRWPLAPAASEAVDGFYGWETAEDGTRFRWTAGPYGSFFVPADVRRIEVPMRAPTEEGSHAPTTIVVRIAGIDRGHFVVGNAWTPIVLDLPPAGLPIAFTRVNFKTERSWQLTTTRPVSAGVRVVGVQVGEWRPISVPEARRPGPRKG